MEKEKGGRENQQNIRRSGCWGREGEIDRDRISTQPPKKHFPFSGRRGEEEDESRRNERRRRGRRQWWSIYRIRFGWRFTMIAAMWMGGRLMKFAVMNILTRFVDSMKYAHFWSVLAVSARFQSWPSVLKSKRTKLCRWWQKLMSRSWWRRHHVVSKKRWEWWQRWR